MSREAQLAGVRVGAQAPRALASDERGLAVGQASADGAQRAGDAPRDELVLARGVRTLQMHRALAVLA